MVFLCAALGVMGLTFAPLGALLPELFPTEVRYTGAASTYNLGGILGASFAPTLAQILEAKGGIAWVGYYIAAAVVSFVAVWSMSETRHDGGGCWGRLAMREPTRHSKRSDPGMKD